MATKEYNLEELLGGSVESITEKFGDLSDDHLTKLAELEGKAENPRSTLTKAIEAEQGGRAITEAETTAQEAAAKAGGRLYTKAELDEYVNAGANGEGLFSQQQLDQKMAEAGKAFEERIAALEDQVKKAKTATAPVSKTSKAKRAKARKLDLSDEADPLSALKSGGTIVFAGEDSTELVELPELTFEASDFETAAGSARQGAPAIVLTKEVEFPESAQRAEVREAWLLGRAGTPQGVCRLIAPLPVGGGTTSRLPAKWLKFDGPAGRPDKASGQLSHAANGE